MLGQVADGKGSVCTVAGDSCVAPFPLSFLFDSTLLLFLCRVEAKASGWPSRGQWLTCELGYHNTALPLIQLATHWASLALPLARAKLELVSGIHIKHNLQDKPVTRCYEDSLDTAGLVSVWKV